MIIACPACATRYAVPDSAIGVDGRTVRCAKCRHSWFQDGPQIDVPEMATAVAAPSPAPPPPPPVNAPDPQPEPVVVEPIADVSPHEEPASEEPAFAEPAPVFANPVTDGSYDQTEYDQTEYDRGESSFAHEPPFRPRRNPARMWMTAAILFAAIALGAIAAVAVYGLPDWVPMARSTFAAAQPDLQLSFPPARQDRRTLPNGTEFFGASGTVTNIGRERRSVPSILIVLSDAHKPVYTWEITPPKRVLAPGESMTINEAVTDVPRSAKYADIGWKPE